MQVRYVPYELLIEIFRENRDDKRPYVEFRSTDELQNWMYDCLNDNKDIHFFSLYGKLAVTVLPRDYMGVLIDIISDMEMFDHGS